MSLQPGTRVGPYEVIHLLGAGGMGEVWLSRELRLDRKVALKLLPRDLTRDPARVLRFEQEARAASALNHPNVCTIHALSESSDGQQFIAMEYVEGETLRRRLAAPRLTIREALDIAMQIAAALSVAHVAGIVHRDIKPENVMLRPDGVVKVLDFGLAKLTTAVQDGSDTTQLGLRTDAGTVVGTPAYMSPEQARGQEVDARTDIWSLGVMLYEMITGRHPFVANSSSEILAAILGRDPTPIARFEPDVPTELQRIISKTLRKDPEQRYQSIKELLVDLRALRDTPAAQTASSPVEYDSTKDVEGSRGDATLARPESSAEYVLTRLAKHKWGATLTAGVLVLIATSGWWFASRRGTVPDELPSVVVLPFNMIGEGAEYFADGITEAVTTELGRVGGLRVISSNTAFQYRNKAANPEIARELGVGLVLRGSVQRAGESVRVDVSLIDPSNDTALWSDRYSRDLTNVLGLQYEISTQIAATLSNRFGGIRRTSKRPSRATQNPEASDAYLRGLSHLKGRSSASPIVQARVGERRLAVDELKRAVELDPDFALARAALASAYTQRLFYDATDAAFERAASQEIDRALEIDPDLAEAYLARAQLTWTALNDFPHEDAIEDLQRAVSINPNLAQAYIELEKVYYHIGLTDKAVEANERAHLLDPSQAGSSNRAFRALVDAGRLPVVRTELERRPNLGAYARGEALVAMGQLDEALQLLANSTITDSADTEYDLGAKALLGVVHARLGHREEAARVIAAVKPAAENRTALSHLHHAQFNIGATLGWLGRHDEAVEWLTKAAFQGYPSYPKFATDQSLSPLKGHAGFSALLEQLRKDWDRRQKIL